MWDTIEIISLPTTATRRDSENQERKVREIKKTYEKQLTGLKLDLKSLKAARKEHARAMKKNVSLSSLCMVVALT